MLRRHFFLDFLSISNHCYSSPYAKTKVGQNMFKSIINEFNSVDKKNELVQRLFEFAKYDAGYKTKLEY